MQKQDFWGKAALQALPQKSGLNKKSNHWTKTPIG